MESRWRKAKAALGLNLCVYLPRTIGDEDDAATRLPYQHRDLPSSPAASTTSHASGAVLMPTTPTPTSSGLRLSKSGSGSSSSSKKKCAICLNTMKPGHGHALFTAECSHTFHFHCITSNVKYGNHVCPVCRAKWKEIPFQGTPSSDISHGRASVNPVLWSQEDGYMTILRSLPRITSRHVQRSEPLLHDSEPNIFDDDEPSESHPVEFLDSQVSCMGTVEMETFPEFWAIPQTASMDVFTVLIHLKAPLASAMSVSDINANSGPAVSQSYRAPVDLVTVLDVSGSMAGTKLALLKRAMGFVIQNLGPSDRLSVIAFSSTARRLFQLRRMSDSGRQQALLAVNSLLSSGGTNIAEGLKKAAKVLDERREKNPVCSIILLSDGQDTYTVPTVLGVSPTQTNYQSLVPSSLCGGAGQQVPVHAFGFGADHDSASMHSISEISGGTFSFIEAESVIQDAFAQCIGGILSVVVQEMQVEIECALPEVHIGSIKSGSYTNQVSVGGQDGSINVGHLYADEERNFLVSINVPPAQNELTLLKVGCNYIDPVSKEVVRVVGREVKILRPEFVMSQTMSIEVDRQRNRIQAAEAMSEARSAAERGALGEAVSILEGCRKILSDSIAGQSGDQLCVALDADLKEMQNRMENRQRYEASGRAYVLSGLSSHSWQRATARGDSTDSASLVHAYRTSSMIDMLQRSQTLSPASCLSKPPILPSRSFPACPHRR